MFDLKQHQNIKLHFKAILTEFCLLCINSSIFIVINREILNENAVLYEYVQ